MSYYFKKKNKMEKLYRELNAVLDMLNSREINEAKIELENIINKVHYEKY